MEGIPEQLREYSIPNKSSMSNRREYLIAISWDRIASGITRVM